MIGAATEGCDTGMAASLDVDSKTHSIVDVWVCVYCCVS